MRLMQVLVNFLLTKNNTKTKPERQKGLLIGIANLAAEGALSNQAHWKNLNQFYVS